MTPTPHLAFIGWLKSGAHRWEPVCSAATERACWTALMDTPRVGSCDLMVLRQGERPEKYKSARAKR